MPSLLIVVQQTLEHLTAKSISASTLTAKSIDITGDLGLSTTAITTNSFYSSGDASVYGNLTVSGKVTSTLKPNATDLDLGGYSASERWNAVYAKNIYASGTASISGAATISGGATISSVLEAKGTLNVSGKVSNHLIPNSTSNDLGDATYRWRTVYANNINSYNISNTNGSVQYPVQFKNTWIGLDGDENDYHVAAIYAESNGGKRRNCGIDAQATSKVATAHNHGVNGEATGGLCAVGVYGYASGATNGNYAGYFGGLVYAKNGVIQESDARLKKDVYTIDGALDKVLKLRGVTYYWKNREEMAAAKGVSAENMKYGYDDKKHIGVIAQELEQEFPELVNTDMDGFKSVNYEGIAPILIEAVKELKAEKDDLQTKVDNQQQQIDELKRLVEELMKK